MTFIPEGDSDAHSGFGDFDDIDGLDRRAGGGPDLFREVSDLPPALPQGRGPKHRLRLFFDRAVPGDGLGAVSHVRYQSLLFQRARTGLSAASPRLLTRGDSDACFGSGDFDD